MGRHKIPTTERRVAISTTLPAATIHAVDIAAEMLSVPRSAIIELALHYYFKGMKEDKTRERKPAP